MSVKRKATGEDKDSDLKRVRFTDVVECCLHSYKTKVNSSDIKLLCKGFVNSVKDKAKKSDSEYLAPAELIEQLDFKGLFTLFVKQRKITLLRYLFSGEVARSDFKFTGNLFVIALEQEAYDIAALLHKEFFKSILLDLPAGEKKGCCGDCSCLRKQKKEEAKENQVVGQALNLIVSSFLKNNGMIDYKCYLARKFQEKFLLRHARLFLDNLTRKVSAKNKENIFVLNVNPVKAACQLIELLEGISYRFHQLKVRVQTIRTKIVEIIKKYLSDVNHEQEMKYLLKDKDFEHRDSIDLIT
jgi:hypothetical protein